MGDVGLLWTFRDSFVSTCSNLWELPRSPWDRDKPVGCCDLHWLHSEISSTLCSITGLKLSHQHFRSTQAPLEIRKTQKNKETKKFEHVCLCTSTNYQKASKFAVLKCFTLNISHLFSNWNSQ